jgi:predicted nucleic acid-binding protein
MKLTNDKVFADSNVLLYLLGDDETKKDIAKSILKSNPAISTQVISENINVLFKKFKDITTGEIIQHTSLLTNYCQVSTVTVATIEKALELKIKYQFQWYDCTILSAALLTTCNIIYSEDLNHNQLIEGTLRIINPFRESE